MSLKLFCLFPVWRKCRLLSSHPSSLPFPTCCWHEGNGTHNIQRREELAVFIQQILGFSWLLLALYSYLGRYQQCFGPQHISHHQHFIWHGVSKSTQHPQPCWEPLAGTQWASTQVPLCSRRVAALVCLLQHSWDNDKFPKT